VTPYKKHNRFVCSNGSQVENMLMVATVTPMALVDEKLHMFM
jgi:hypothetical protein